MNADASPAKNNDFPDSQVSFQGVTLLSIQDSKIHRTFSCLFLATQEARIGLPTL